MKQCINKNEFIEELKLQLRNLGINADSDIIEDFEQHFEQGIAAGLTETQICEQLGDVSEIAKQYASEFSQFSDNQNSNKEIQDQNNDMSAYSSSGQQTGQSDGFQNQTAGQQSTMQYSNKKSGINVSGLIGLICLDVFVLSWAIPSLGAVIISYCCIPLSLSLAGVVSIFSDAINSFTNQWFMVVTPFHPVTNVFLGIALLAISGLLAVLAVKIVKGFINIIKSLVNWHIRVTGGKNV